MAEPHADPVRESRRLIDAATSKGVTVRAIGGVAVQLRSPADGPILPREIRDIDLVTRRGTRTAVTNLLASAGYLPDEMFNALHGARRLLFYDEVNQRKLDVFVGEFVMCHPIPIAERLDRHPLTVPLAELLLTKLQIVELTERDQRDIYNLVYHHEIVSFEGEGIEADYVAEVCARDWGLWRTASMTIERSSAHVGDYSLDPQAAATIAGRLKAIRETMEGAPKSARWKLRSRVGERMRWYEEPEENHA